MNDADWKAVRCMEVYGGGFVGALAEAFYRADEINFSRLKAAFPDYWKQYEEMAAQTTLDKLKKIEGARKR